MKTIIKAADMRATSEANDISCSDHILIYRAMREINSSAHDGLYQCLVKLRTPKEGDFLRDVLKEAGYAVEAEWDEGIGQLRVNWRAS